MEGCPKRMRSSRVTVLVLDSPFAFQGLLKPRDLSSGSHERIYTIVNYASDLYLLTQYGLVGPKSSKFSAARFDNYCSKCYHELFGSTPKTPSQTSDTASNASDTETSMSTTATVSSPMRTTQPISIASPKMSSASFSNSSNLKVSSSLPASTFASSMMDVDSPIVSPGTSPASVGENNGFLRKKRNQCAAPGCKKKLGLTAVECHCGHTYCSDHRYADKHNCPYDYKGAKTEILTKANPTIAPKKVADI